MSIVELSVPESLLVSFVELIPNILGALFLLAFGWLLGRLVQKTLLKIFKKVKIDNRIKIGQKYKFSEIFSVVVKWVIYLLFVQSAAETLEITFLSIYFGQITLILEGVIVLFAIYLIVKYFQKKIKTKN